MDALLVQTSPFSRSARTSWKPFTQRAHFVKTVISLSYYIVEKVFKDKVESTL